MATTSLNIMQERELARLIDYERATCTVDGDLMYRCAFPYRPEDDLQRELIERGVLQRKPDGQHKYVVTISTEGYSYFPALTREQQERDRAQRREFRLVGYSATFAALCLILGFLLGHFFA